MVANSRRQFAGRRKDLLFKYKLSQFLYLIRLLGAGSAFFRDQTRGDSELSKRSRPIRFAEGFIPRLCPLALRFLFQFLGGNFPVLILVAKINKGPGDGRFIIERVLSLFFFSQRFSDT